MKTELKNQIRIHPDFKKAILAVNNLNVALQKEGLCQALEEFRIALSKHDNRSIFEKFYDSVSEFLFGGQSFFTKSINSL
ncbi:hypothetical protein [Flavobacterium sp. 3-210]